jgi:uncharacterized membrane-anchored protein YitT (DUF2179 family)
MTWLLWRQHRLQGLIASIAIAAFAVAVAITGVHMAQDYDAAQSACGPRASCTVLSGLFRGDGAIIDIVHLTIAVPVLLGLFLGATLIAREVENGTNVLAWTQTTTRRQWVVAKIGMAIGATLVCSALVSLLVTWWSGTPNSLNGDRFEGAQFDTQNVVPIAHALFAVCLGIAAGALIRRTLPAIVTTLALYTAVRIVVAIYVRPHYLAARSAETSLATDSGVPSGSWLLSTKTVDGAGQLVAGRVPVPASCAGADGKGAVLDCLGRVGYRDIVTYHPASQYWSFQLIESAIFVGLGVVLAGAALWYTLRHDG